MADEKKVGSRLRRRASGRAGQPIQGVGSAYEANQRQAGVPNASSAAQWAALPEEERQRRTQQMEEERAQLEEMRDELDHAVDVEGFRLNPSLATRVSNYDADATRQQYKELVEWREAKIDKEIEEAQVPNVTDAIQEQMRVDPEDPYYVPAQDRVRRKFIEEQLEELPFEQMVFRGYIEQEVPVHPSLKVQFRSITSQQSLWIDELALDQRFSSQQAYARWIAMAQLAVSVQTMNDKEIGPNLNEVGDDKEAFQKALSARLRRIADMPSVLTDDLVANYLWFTGRLRKVLAGNVTARVGNS